MRCIIDIRAHSHAARAIISPSGEMMTTASEDGTVRRWRIIAGWSSPDKVVDELERRMAQPASPAYPPLDLALDVWRVLLRVRSLPTLTAEVRRRAEALASTIAAQLRSTARPTLVESTAARIRSPYHRVLAVDAGLAALWAVT